MVIDTTTTFATLLIGIAHALHIAIIIVRPDKRNIFRHPQSCIIDVEGLLVRHEDLGQVGGLCLLVLLEDGALLGHHLFQCTGSHLGILAALHGLVVQATHPHRIDIIVLGCLMDAVVKLLENGLAVGLVIPLAITGLVPLRRGSIVEEQGFTMAGGNHDAPLISHHLTFFVAIEGSCTGVHRRCQHVAFQAEDELADLVISLGTNIAQFLLIVLGSPRLQTPVLVIDEHSTILDAGRLRREVLFIVKDALVQLIYRYIGKPIPR